LRIVNDLRRDIERDGFSFAGERVDAKGTKLGRASWHRRFHVMARLGRTIRDNTMARAMAPYGQTMAGQDLGFPWFGHFATRVSACPCDAFRPLPSPRAGGDAK
jgi:hypothetical protein